ncbi:MAG: glycosyltransferase family 1 protein [Patescibacteria group bacterium]
MSNSSQKISYTLGIDASRANSTTRTGTEWYAYWVIQELKHLIPDDYRVVLYSKEDLCADLAADLPAHWESRILRWRWRFWTQLRLSWEMLVQPPDALFVPAHTLPLILPRHAVTTLHDVGFLTEPSAYSFGERLYHRLATRFALRRADRILTVSDFSRRELVRLCRAEEKKISVTPLACDMRLFRSDFSADEIESVRNRHRLPQKYFLFVGRLERKKNFALLLEAFTRYVESGGQLDLALIGKRGLGAAEASDGLSDKVRARIFEPGYVSSIDLPKLFAGATAFVFPSRYEGFGMPILEAFASGVPVIAADATAIPEVAGGAGWLVGLDDVVGLVEAMQVIESDSVLRARLIKAGLERVSQFSWEKTAELTWENLRSILDKIR